MNMANTRARRIKDRIKIIEASQNMPEAARNLGIDTTTLYHWLSNNNLKVTYDNRLKVVAKDG